MLHKKTLDAITNRATDPTWDGVTMTETEISNEIISGLGIMLAPVVARK